MKDEYDHYKEISKELDQKVSPSFCLAKWYHSNIYFQTGETHSCYHPAPHKISIEEVQQNPAALHNTSTKFQERREMLEGKRPEGCQYCWNIEDINRDLISDRQIRTGSLYKEERIQDIQKHSDQFFVSPDYVEVSFSNLCNFKCGYCHPKASSRFYKEIEQFGPYEKSKNHRCDIDWFEIYNEENNPFLEAWWKWWPELSQGLKILRVTGGEPLMQQSTYRLMDRLEQNPVPHLELNVNSNLGSQEKIIQKFSDKIQKLVQEKKIKNFKLFTSIDSWGPQAEYTRHGLDLQLFEKNLKNYLSQTDLPLTIMITFNIFSLPNFKNLLQKILEWRTEFQSTHTDFMKFHRIRFDLSYLKEPLQFDINILPKENFLKYLEESLQFMKDNLDDNSKVKFSYMEYQRLLRTYEYMKTTHYPAKKIKEGQLDFYRFFKEYDKRKNVSLTETFPELREFWENCKNLAEK